VVAGYSVTAVVLATYVARLFQRARTAKRQAAAIAARRAD
jgi:hypothetical protein